jgi:hypothetical protein
VNLLRGTRHGPVTTVSPAWLALWKRLRSCHSPHLACAGVANLWPGQDAGSQQGVDLASYISGYVDGEGCFNVSLSPRPTLAVGWEVRPSFSVSQNGDRAEVLTMLQQHFGCGTIRPDRSDKTLKWEIRSLPPILDRILPHFRRHPLLSSKQKDFELFALICEAMARGEHRTVCGLIDIGGRAGQMNPSGKRRYLPVQILQSLTEMKA